MRKLFLEFEKVPSRGRLSPVFAGQLLKIKVFKLYWIRCDYLPSPLDLPPITGIDPKTGNEIVRASSDY